MRREKKESIIDDSPSIVDWCYIGKAIVYEDKGRSNGYFYAKVPFVHEKHIDDTSRGYPSIYKGEKSLEVILNGPGLSKAKQKIIRDLTSKGYIIKEDFKVLRG